MENQIMGLQTEKDGRRKRQEKEDLPSKEVKESESS